MDGLLRLTLTRVPTAWLRAGLGVTPKPFCLCRRLGLAPAESVAIVAGAIPSSARLFSAGDES
jgi:hypothetical protein